MQFAIGTFSREDGTRLCGIVVDETVIPLDRIATSSPRFDLLRQHGSVRSLLEDWDRAFPLLNEAVRHLDPADGFRLDALHVHPPVDLPRQIFCTGANYRQHVIDLTLDAGAGPEHLSGPELRRWAEDMMDERARHGEPYVFVKPVSAVVGANDPIVLPATSEKVDWELELAVVIGRGGRHIRREDALAHVAGYTIANDVTARDLVQRHDYKMLGTDWLRAKGQPSFLPLGPLLVPAAFVQDPHDLGLLLKLNGSTMQNERTSDMIFRIERQIEYISTFADLLPGDVIATGSPAGNGTHYGRFLQDGDQVEATISGLGVQRNLCVREAGR